MIKLIWFIGAVIVGIKIQFIANEEHRLWLTYSMFIVFLIIYSLGDILKAINKEKEK